MRAKIYQQIVKQAGPLITYYRTDLLKCDRDFLKQAPDDLPFLHYTRDSGTHIVALHQQQHLDELFSGSDTIRYIFGNVSRSQFIRKKLEEHEAIMANFGSEIALILFYDPVRGKVVRISPELAREIVGNYVSNTK